MRHAILTRTPRSGWERYTGAAEATALDPAGRVLARPSQGGLIRSGPGGRGRGLASAGPAAGGTVGGRAGPLDPPPPAARAAPAEA